MGLHRSFIWLLAFLFLHVIACDDGDGPTDGDADADGDSDGDGDGDADGDSDGDGDGDGDGDADGDSDGDGDADADGDSDGDGDADADGDSDGDGDGDGDGDSDGDADGDADGDGNLLIDYGFEDWTGDAQTTPGYIFSTAYEEYWTEDHLPSTEVVSSCAGGSAHSGTFFFHRSFYTGGVDDCLGEMSGSINARCNVGGSFAFPEGSGDNTRLGTDVISETMFTRFYFRTSGDWKTQSGMGFLKFLRLYGNGAGGDDSSAFVHLECGDNIDTQWRIADLTGTTWSEIWGTNFTAGADLQDGEWHSVCAQFVRNNDTNDTGNITITVWWDDWDMVGEPAGSRTVTVPDFGDGFSHLSLQQNWSATYPSSAMGIDIDDFQLWDGMP